ncbi:hypothetical protein E5288_WYG005148 [Bos mutus]|uniref:Uncharacterized protein n=1 Tax=Bos mutus TaxID=72004 RepID=A0A6B0RZ24_9CETA|nr:hypothetical protein [Bos mutus]
MNQTLQPLSPPSADGPAASHPQGTGKLRTKSTLEIQDPPVTRVTSRPIGRVRLPIPESKGFYLLHPNWKQASTADTVFGAFQDKGRRPLIRKLERPVPDGAAVDRMTCGGMHRGGRGASVLDGGPLTPSLTHPGRGTCWADSETPVSPACWTRAVSNKKRICFGHLLRRETWIREAMGSWGMSGRKCGVYSCGRTCSSLEGPLWTQPGSPSAAPCRSASGFAAATEKLAVPQLVEITQRPRPPLLVRPNLPIARGGPTGLGPIDGPVKPPGALGPGWGQVPAVLDPGCISLLLVILEAWSSRSFSMVLCGMRPKPAFPFGEVINSLRQHCLLFIFIDPIANNRESSIWIKAHLMLDAA